MEPIRLIAQIDKITTAKDGGVKVTLEVGLESLHAVQDLVELTMNGKPMVMIAMSPMDD